MAYMLEATRFKRYKAGTFKNQAKVSQDKKIALKVKAYTNLRISATKVSTLKS